MEFELKNNDNVLTVKVSGRLDTMTAPKLEEELSNSTNGVEEVVFDLEKLDYISSTGIRILMATKKKIDNMKVVKPKDEILEIFEMTGLVDVFNIEQ